MNDVDAMETELVGLRLRGQVSDTAFERQSALFRAERTHYADETGRQTQALETMKKAHEALKGLEKLREQIVGRLESATPEDRRWVLETLKTRVTVRKENVEVSIGIASQNETEIVSTAPGCPGMTPISTHRPRFRRRAGPPRR